VAILEEELKIKAVEVEKKKVVADEQAAIVGARKEIVEVENDKAEIEAAKCAKIKTEVSELLAGVNKDLEAALPLVEKAEKALQGLDIKDFQFLKALPSPPSAIEKVFFVVCHLIAGVHPNVPVDKKRKLNAPNGVWKLSVALMKNPKDFVEFLDKFKAAIDEQKTSPHGFKAIRETLQDPEFNVESIITKSKAAAGLCDWVINIIDYYDVVIEVEPKRRAVAKANADLAAASEKKAEVDALVAKLNEELAVL